MHTSSHKKKAMQHMIFDTASTRMSARLKASYGLVITVTSACMCTTTSPLPFSSTIFAIGRKVPPKSDLTFFKGDVSMLWTHCSKFFPFNFNSKQYFRFHYKRYVLRLILNQKLQCQKIGNLKKNEPISKIYLLYSLITF
jgi:hypothetical protein